MKLFLSIATLSIASTSLFSQVGAVASDFTQTDLDGTTHTLYDYLNDGKVVIVDMSATWCSPCWSFHQAHYLETLHTQFGPGGTNEAVVLFYEDDTSTTLADIQGTGGNTMGDWTAGVTYPIINATQTLPSEYGTGYPTISVICPTDNKIKDNLFNYSNSDDMVNAVQGIISDCSTTGIVEPTTNLSFDIAPNPTKGNIIITMNSTFAETSLVNVYSVSGQLVETKKESMNIGENKFELDLSTYPVGTYYVKITSDNYISQTIPMVKH